MNKDKLAMALLEFQRQMTKCIQMYTPQGPISEQRRGRVMPPLSCMKETAIIVFWKGFIILKIHELDNLAFECCADRMIYYKISKNSTERFAYNNRKWIILFHVDN